MPTSPSSVSGLPDDPLVAAAIVAAIRKKKGRRPHWLPEAAKRAAARGPWALEGLFRALNNRPR